MEPVLGEIAYDARRLNELLCMYNLVYVDHEKHWAIVIHRYVNLEVAPYPTRPYQIRITNARNPKPQSYIRRDNYPTLDDLLACEYQNGIDLTRFRLDRIR